jgi:hypothetical protein
MKQAAFIFLFIFSMAQTLPAIIHLCKSNSFAIFNPDEEKGNQRISIPSEENKVKTDAVYVSICYQPGYIKSQWVTQFNLQLSLPCPHIDIPTLPPDLS